MKKVYAIAGMIAVFPVLFASAQNTERPRLDQLPASAKQKMLNREIKDIKKVEQQTERKVELKAELKGEPNVAPTAELNVSEFQIKRNELKGQVVELTFDKVVSLKQVGQEGYMAMVTYESPRMAEGLNMVVPEDGLKFFEELSRPEIRRKESVYIQVVNPSTVRALGTRYRKDKPEGERYSW